MNKPRKSLVVFADDRKFSATESTEDQLLGVVRNDMEKVEKWLRLNKLKVIHSQPGLVFRDRSPSYYPCLQELTVGDSTIRR